MFDELVGLAQAGVVRPLVRQRFPLDQPPQALEAIASRATVGKVVLVP